MKQPEFDIIVVGGGHAGVEAAQISAFRGMKTALLTLDRRAVARMSCNPAIGGLAKGQIVRELDVLGGLMPRIADQAGIQFKMLNRSKGRSVWSPRAQVDKRHYEHLIQQELVRLQNLTILEGEAVAIIERNGVVAGVELRGGYHLKGSSVVLTCGTFLNGLIHIGNRKIRAGRMGEPNSEGITESLAALGFKHGRLKTGTPPRLIRQSVDWEKTSPIHGDSSPVPFSYRTRNFSPPDIPCHQTRTNPDCHSIIETNLYTSPMFSGDVFGTGPRYCPSIEDKIHRFRHQDSHTLFLEPEWTDSDQIYVNGFSTSLPEDVQLKSLRRVSGLERVEFFRPGYAIEYDFIFPAQHKASLESKLISGLFFAGQINGTSGYEEAAVQGLLAGVNAVCRLQQKPPLVLGRDQAYAGVLIDDLITKDTLEPYRMFTSRAEYRLLLRFTNADSRLVKLAYNFDLIEPRQFDFLMSKLETQQKILAALSASLAPASINFRLQEIGEPLLESKQPAKTVLRRPGVTIHDLPRDLFFDIPLDHLEKPFLEESFTEAEIEIKYEGYVARQLQQIKKLKHQETFNIPASIDYKSITSLSTEGREKLGAIRPETLGQAMRISGVTPADIAVLSVLLARR